MAFFIFIIVLGVLVFVHELGHFLVAKWAKVRVDEFGFGYPPRALKLGVKWGTLFSLNWIPFGGFVKIYGENYEEEEECPQESSSSESPRISSSSSVFSSAGEARLSSEDFPVGKNFTQVSKKWQSAILVAGVLFNLIFAWLLISLGFMIGLPTSSDNEMNLPVKNPELMITQILSDSPVKIAGLKVGDKIKNVKNNAGLNLQKLDPESTSEFVNNSSGEIKIEIDRGGQILDFKVLPKEGIIEGRKIVGINMDTVGILQLSLPKAFYEGFKTTGKILSETVYGLFNLIKEGVKGKADVSQMSGPVGIVGLVGDASKLGFIYLLTFTALISINLAVINLIPFPALDGGRILFVIIEAITRKKINAKIAGILNSVGFVILIILMIFITYRDILKLF